MIVHEERDHARQANARWLYRQPYRVNGVTYVAAKDSDFLNIFGGIEAKRC